MHFVTVREAVEADVKVAHRFGVYFHTYCLTCGNRHGQYRHKSKALDSTDSHPHVNKI